MPGRVATEPPRQNPFGENGLRTQGGSVGHSFGGSNGRRLAADRRGREFGSLTVASAVVPGPAARERYHIEHLPVRTARISATIDQSPICFGACHVGLPSKPTASRCVRLDPGRANRPAVALTPANEASYESHALRKNKFCPEPDISNIVRVIIAPSSAVIDD
jgi:hypothetical protein